MITNITLVGTRQGFRALAPLVFELWTKTCRADTAEGQKFKIFNVFEFHHAGCLHRGFQTRWIDSWCLFYSRMIGFRDNGQKLAFLTQRGSKIPMYQSSKLCHYRCLNWGFLIRWVYSWPSFYSKMIKFTGKWTFGAKTSKFLDRFLGFILV